MGRLNDEVFKLIVGHDTQIALNGQSALKEQNIGENNCPRKFVPVSILPEIICLGDENVLIRMCFGSVTYLLALSLSIFTGIIPRGHISVKFHLTDLAPCRPSKAAGPSNGFRENTFVTNVITRSKFIFMFLFIIDK